MGLLMRSWVAGVSCFVVGVAVDLDHFLDLWINRGFSLSYRQLVEFCYRGSSPTFYDVLHAYEYIPLLLWLTTIPSFRNLGWGLTVGYVLHLLGDQFYNTHLNRWTYFLTYRLYHRFDSSKIVLGPSRDQESVF